VKVFSSEKDFTKSERNKTFDVHENEFGSNFREVAAYKSLLQNLFTIASSLVEIHKKSETVSLYSEVGTYDNAIRRTMDSIDLKVFWGRALSFHVCLDFRDDRSRRLKNYYHVDSFLSLSNYQRNNLLS
jgi:hypothetical protein